MIEAGTEREPSEDLRKTVTVYNDGMSLRVTDLSDDAQTVQVIGVPMYYAAYEDDIDD